MSRRTANIEIRPNDRGGWHLLVDGTDISELVSTASVRFQNATAIVDVRLIPLKLASLDLPDAVLRIVDDAETMQPGRFEPRGLHDVYLPTRTEAPPPTGDGAKQPREGRK
jgi:hypothetical protein